MSVAGHALLYDLEDNNKRYKLAAAARATDIGDGWEHEMWMFLKIQTRG
ncbi:hypothetical protein DI53_1837 [Sphingobacterium deserti]|uniref:Uncharacterized protein n=2 Tax=Sphingobacterium deserti TaxID=1229276 RepID=A0A0B8T8X1_9SPHI|nr:hypothetical protein DI53_1837 [Sphingobacterium deserti]